MARSLFSVMLMAAAVLAQPVYAQVSGKNLSMQELQTRLHTAQADAANYQTSLERGRRLAAFCANCHGNNGNSSIPDVPNLAGQNSSYLLEQMERFVDGRRRDTFMQGLIKAMTPSERVDTVLFFTTQPVNAQPIVNAGMVARGKSYFERICFRCHGRNGYGDEKIARLAGQQAPYVIKTLKRYRDGTGERIEPQMAANTKFMTDEEVEAVATYISTMR